MTRSVETLFFLPGASGNTDFWKPVASRLRHPAGRRFVGWPGFGGLPADPAIGGLEGLVGRVAGEIEGPVDLLAQSMGGVVALASALEQPSRVKHLVLTATSGGLDVAALGGVNWRGWFRERNPTVPRWFEDSRIDLTERLGEIVCPVLLLFGDADPISPPAVGERLAKLLPRSELIVVPGGTHDLANERADEIAPHVEHHLALA